MAMAMAAMKVLFVVPRYGTEVVGGAETAARLLAEHLARLAGWEVSVATTAAKDFVTWADEYPPGREWINGVKVDRYASEHGRLPDFHPLSAALLADPTSATGEEADRWLEYQGPYCPELVEAVVTAEADVVVFYPYLYFPTVRAIGRVRVPAVLHPAAHDEPALRLPIFPAVYDAADALVFQTRAERRLVEHAFPVAHHRQLLLGLGVDDPDEVGSTVGGNPPGSGQRTPYLVCLGRVDRMKGSFLLASWFARYKRRRPGPLRLVYAGPLVEAPPDHGDVDVLGVVDDATKWSLLAGATALVSPSPFEAFSLVVAEAWSARCPVLVNAACGPTVEQCLRSGGGLVFGGYGAFEAALDRLSADPVVRDRLGANGRHYVAGRYRWPVVVERYARFLEETVARSR
jgi:glycosyltransferase involved in cell wall biosynthesis